MLRAVLYIILLSIGFTLAEAQELDSTHIQFKSIAKDFHAIYEADGNIAVQFEYTNTGNAPLKINRVIAHGFAQVKHTKDAIAPGDTAIIEAVVNPYGNIGYFKKYLTVFTNTVDSPHNLSVKGIIINGTHKSSFKYSIGGVAFKQLQLNFGYIYQGDRMVRYIPVMNNSDRPLRVEYNVIPKHLSIDNKFEELMPGTTGLIEIVYNTNLINDWDFVIDKIKINIIDSRESTSGELMVTANLRENFAFLSPEEKAITPKVDIPIKSYDFDTIPTGKKIEFEFPIYNKGDRALEIRAVKPTCGCTAAMPKKKIISPGDSTIIMVEYNSSGFSGVNKKGVTVITNDPYNYKQFLWITGYVK
jgi:hypothetical protein